MKNKLLILLLALMLAVSMTACSQKTAGKSAEKSGGKSQSKQTESVSSQEEDEDVDEEGEAAEEQEPEEQAEQEEPPLEGFFDALNENLEEKIDVSDVTEISKGKYAVIIGKSVQMEVKGNPDDGDFVAELLYDDGTEGIEDLVHGIVLVLDDEAATAVEVMLDDFAHSNGKYPDYVIGKVKCSYEKDDSGLVTLRIEQYKVKKA